MAEDPPEPRLGQLFARLICEDRAWRVVALCYAEALARNDIPLGTFLGIPPSEGAQAVLRLHRTTYSLFYRLAYPDKFTGRPIDRPGARTIDACVFETVENMRQDDEANGRKRRSVNSACRHLVNRWRGTLPADVLAAPNLEGGTPDVTAEALRSRYKREARRRALGAPEPPPLSS